MSDAAVRSGMPLEFVRDCWYVAALAHEIGSEPVHKTILGEPVALYRGASGNVVALFDRCPHRSYPLSRGSVHGDTLVCGYHGFTFDGSGTCVAVPGQSNVPRAARVAVYPVVERSPFVWIWIGDPARAAATPVPDHRYTHDPAWTTYSVKSTLIACRYGLLLDNLLDLSHETYLHAATIGTKDVAETPISTEVDGLTVKVSRRMIAADCPPFYQVATGITGKIDRAQDIEFGVPSFYTLHVRVAPTGETEGGAHLKVMYAVTPETRNTTHDFWALSRDFARDQEWVTERMTDLQDRIVREDQVALEALEATLPPAGVVPEISINIDRGGLQARRLIHDLIAGNRRQPAALTQPSSAV